MKVKIDTKEIFHVITIEETLISANMTGDLTQMLLPFIKSPINNIVVKLNTVAEINLIIAQTLLHLQQTFYENNCSFVICELQKGVLDFFYRSELLEALNFAPTESEAWDIVQMEEIEREFLH